MTTFVGAVPAELSCTPTLATPRRVSELVAGIVWFRRVMAHFRKVAWLNPTPYAHWGWTQSNAIIRELVGDKMYPLTPDGLTAATRWLAK